MQIVNLLKLLIDPENMLSAINVKFEILFLFFLFLFFLIQVFYDFF